VRGIDDSGYIHGAETDMATSKMEEFVLVGVRSSSSGCHICDNRADKSAANRRQESATALTASVGAGDAGSERRASYDEVDEKKRITHLGTGQVSISDSFVRKNSKRLRGSKDST
jgi:hypothetical protein